MRFTLKTMLAAVSAAALVCTVFFALPGMISLIVLGVFWMLLPAALVAGIVYGRGYGRAFSIGAVVTGGCMPMLWLYAMFSGFAIISDIDFADSGGEEVVILQIYFAVIFGCIAASGLVSMAVRWWSLRQQSAATPVPAAHSLLHGRVTTVELQRSAPNSTHREETGAP